MQYVIVEITIYFCDDSANHTKLCGPMTFSCHVPQVHVKYDQQSHEIFNTIQSVIEGFIITMNFHEGYKVFNFKECEPYVKCYFNFLQVLDCIRDS